MHQWAQEVTDIAQARDPKEAKKVIVQTLFTETWQDEEDAKPGTSPMLERREDYTIKTVPSGVIRVTAGMDVQDDRLECVINGWGKGEECWAIRYIVCRGDTTKQQVWNAMEAALSIQIVREDGVILPIRAVAVDTSAPKSQSMAYDFIRPRQPKGWIAIKGSSQPDFPAIGRANKSKVTRVSLMIVGTNRIKGWIYDRATNQTPGTPGYMHYPLPGDGETGFDEVYFAGLFSETSMPVWKHGVRLRQFTCENGVRNEPLDVQVYSMAALYALGPCNWDLEEKRLRETIETKPEAPIIRNNNHSRGGFTGGAGWKV